MTTTGEECWHQKPLRTKLDEAYDVLFDPAIQHNCDVFHELVVPAQRCGAACPRFKPIGPAPHSNLLPEAKPGSLRTFSTLVPIPPTAPRDLAVIQAEVAHTRDAAFRTSMRRCLSGVYQRLDANLERLRRQIAICEERSRKLDAWLSRPERQPEWLRRAYAKAESEHTHVTVRLQMLESELNPKQPSYCHPQTRDQRKIQLEASSAYKRSCEQVMRFAKLRQRERAQKQDEFERNRVEWQDACKREQLLATLRQEAGRCVRDSLASPGFLLRTEIDHVIEFLNEIACFADGNVPITDLQRKVEAISGRK